MEILLRSFDPGVHCYSPFPKCPLLGSLQTLEELCRSVILRCVTLRRLTIAVHSLPLPKRLKGYITDLSTADFEPIECAPFSDPFSLHFCHRALTYRVTSIHDGHEYMIAYGHSPVEPDKLKSSHQEWLKIQHKNIMCVHARVMDPATDNVFYVYDQPFVSLGQLWTIFYAKNYHVPMEFFWRLTTDLCEALSTISSNGLYYGNFGLDNIFVTDDRLVLENGLMHKSFKSAYGKNSSQERNAISSVINVLKMLLECSDDKVPYNDGLGNLIREIECQGTIENVLNAVCGSFNSIEDFSFIKHIYDLQNL